MKRVACLVLLPLLFSCRKDHSSYEQRAVTSYIRRTMDKRGLDFDADYIPVSWDTLAVSRRDSLLWYIGPVPAPAAVAALPRYQRKRLEQAVASRAYRDTTRIGTYVVHVFRWKGEDNRLSTDTLRYLVFRNGLMVRSFR
ncbi:hypothetical protein EJV47_01710 [Hymenobacter gummosus]|uniref:Uncharacterized protein n=1 Tax=Hymenobacter gummosus TaxID=1776032 RepID=A0A3S0HCI2_9BACT|nr:hypothetical protein [Hymenobacter gummosus]RTQ53482.1 hypothetical protein EJV47_01710 [Hymenobacter gummosus]